MKNILLSLFQGYTDKRPTPTRLDNIVEMIRNHAPTAAHTEKFRYNSAHGWDREASREKASCPCFAVAVHFNGGKLKTDIQDWTMLCLADFDHLPVEEMNHALELIRKDPHTLLAYTTISGTGIRVISRYFRGQNCQARSPYDLHLQAFAQINQYYAELIGHPYDEKCKNATRLSGLAHDPDVFFNPEAEAFCIESKMLPKKNEKETPNRPLKRAVRAAERQLADEGVEYIEHHHNEYIMRTGYLLNAYGIPLETATQWALKRFGDYEGDVAGIFRSCYQQTEEHGTLRLPSSSRPTDETEGKPANVAEIEEFLTTQGRFRKNTVTGRCEIATDGEKFTDLTDRHVNTLWCRYCKEKKPVRLMDMRVIIESEYSELYNPFENYFKSLPAWDENTDPIARLAAQVHVQGDSGWFVLCFKKWLVAMVAALLKEEVVNHSILVLVGCQGIYKTTWLNNLLPPELRRYFYLKTNSRNLTKDDTLTLSEFAIVCLEELDEMESKEMNQLKALTTMRTINERAAYAHYKENRPHIASFCGTSNNMHFLNDLSGNRRWMPFEVESIDNPYENPVDYTAVYAQAYALLQKDFHYWLTPQETEMLNLHNKHFEVPCLEKELILTYYERPMPEATNAIFVTNAQILARINAGLKQKLSPSKIGIIMRQEGFEPIRSGGKRGYRVIELSEEAIYRKRMALARFS